MSNSLFKFNTTQLLDTNASFTIENVMPILSLFIGKIVLVNYKIELLLHVLEIYIPHQ